MPDWTYHPFFKPLLFRLSPETGRRLTLGLLAVQGRTALGRRVFRFFGHGPAPPELTVTAFGVRFPAAVGLGSGIDTHGVATSVMQHLGFGFVVLGPVGAEASPRRYEAEPLRIPERHALVTSAAAGAPAARELAARLRASADPGLRIGVALRGASPETAIQALDDIASFYIIASRDLDHLRTATSATQRPILLQLSADDTPDAALSMLERARDLGAKGCVVSGGVRTDLVPEGEVTGPFLRDRVLETIRTITRVLGDRMPIVAAGGIVTPEDALACLDAGATLVSLYEGLVYAGPGLPGRILHALESGRAPGEQPPRASLPPPLRVGPRHVETGETPLAGRLGWRLLAFTGWVLIASGIAALGLAATVKLLPYDVHYLGLTVADLCGRSACRIVHFMAHDRVSFGGSILSIGILYTQLAKEVRDGHAWAWWTLVVSGVVGFASFLSYLGFGYLDVWHGRATVALLPCFVCGLAFSYASLTKPRGPGSLFRPQARAWMWSPAGLGRACLTFSAFGMILGGMVILWIGMTRVFVPQDLAFMGVTPAELQAVSPRLVPLIAHDRAGFGGGLASGGLTVMFSVWCGTRPAARAMWRALLLAGTVGFACAIGIHPVVGYTSFVHLLPACAGALSFVVGIALLYAPMCRTDHASTRFPDI
jgi:dihydroorotate dehydrogenase